MINPRYYEYALMIERFGSFKRAALELHLSQPALSKGIAALEQEYNVEIFDRENRPLTPTHAGKLILEEAQRVLQGDNLLKSRLLELHGVINHKFRIAWGPYASKVYAADLLTCFQTQYPKSELQFINAGWKDLPRLLRNRQVDMFIGDISTPGLKDEFKVYPLPQDVIDFICNPQHPLAQTTYLDPENICSQALALCSPPPWAKKWLKLHMNSYDSRESPASLRGDDYRLIEEIILTNPKIATLASRACFEHHIATGKLVAVPMKNAPYLQAGMVIDPSMQPPTLLEELIQLVINLSTQKKFTQRPPQTTNPASI
ncbi:LysR family transcriptional regulator [Kiritimatiellota bacterium B12222]|nr:LysR family transcriptional regulator [Kiritimatiellota bacterium B12222]